MYFFRKYRDRMMVTAVAIILIVIIGLTSKERMSLTKFENFFGNALRPIKKVGYSVGNRINTSLESVLNVTRLSKENKELKIEVARLREENANLENLIGQSDILINEAQLIEETKYKLLPAQVTGKQPGNWYDVFTIDKGLKDGLSKGDTIIQAIELDKDTIYEGLVGRVVDVGNNWAKVVSIIDELNKMGFKIIRTQDGGILSGSVDNVLSGYLYDNEADVIVGDKLYTSGIGTVFEKDIYIGEVEEVIEVEEELTKKIIVKPAVDFKKLYRVFAIIE